jgi:SAM-dependent methyltransferase
MNEPTLTTQIAAATGYEAHLGPALISEWAPRVVDAAAIRSGHRVLDVACGTGILSRAVAEAVGPAGDVIGLDLDPGMLVVAARVAPGIALHRGTAEMLPFTDHAFDAVVSQFGLMFFQDRTRALREMWRVLRPGGRLVVAVWASLHDTPAYAAEVALVERFAGRAAADVLRSPFAIGDPSQLERAFTDAGIPLNSVTTQIGTGHFPSIRAMLNADLREWLPTMGVCLTPPLIDEIIAEAEAVLHQYVRADGSVRFDSPAHIAVARRPLS